METTRFLIEGYRSLKSVTWSPRSLNVLIGPNGSGKSNLLRSLALFQRAVTNQDFSKDLLQQGGIQNVLWDRRSTALRWQVLSQPIEGFHKRAEPPQHLMYILDVQPAPWLPNGYRIALEELRECYYVRKTWEFEYLLKRTGATAVLDDESPERNVTNKDELPPDQTLIALNPLATPSTWLFRNAIETWGVYHDLQVYEGAPIRQAAVARVESRVAPDGQNLVPVLHTLYTSNREFKRQLDAAMKTAFGDEYEEIVFPPAEDRKISLRIRWKSLRTEQSAAELSDGTIRFLLLATILANPSAGELIAIDEPEVGLHPGMLPIVAEFAAGAAQHKTVILTTHSPQFLDAFKENLPSTTVAQCIGGETKLSVLKGEDLGRWLQEFSLGNLFKSGELEDMA